MDLHARTSGPFVTCQAGAAHTLRTGFATRVRLRPLSRLRCVHLGDDCPMRRPGVQQLLSGAQSGRSTSISRMRRMQLTLPPARSQDTTPHPRARGSLTTKACAKMASSPPFPLPGHSNVYLRGFPLEWGEAELLALCRAHGPVTSIRVVAGEQQGGSAGTSGCSNHAFVKYELPEQVGRCPGPLRLGMSRPNTRGWAATLPPTEQRAVVARRTPQVCLRLSTATHSSRRRGSRSQRRQASLGRAG